MKNILTLLLLLFSINLYGQISVGSPLLQATDTVGLLTHIITIRPFQKVEFDLFVKALVNKLVIADSTGKTLYQSKKPRSHYEYITGLSSIYLKVFDLTNHNFNKAYFGITDEFNADIIFARSDKTNDAEVKITTIMLPGKTQGNDQYSVRLADFTYTIKLLIGPLIISLSKFANPVISPPGRIKSYISTEMDTVTSVYSFQLIKDFILHSKYIRNGIIDIKKHSGDIVFTFNYKQAYYINNKDIVGFFGALALYMKDKNADQNLLKYISYFNKVN